MASATEARATPATKPPVPKNPLANLDIVEPKDANGLPLTALLIAPNPEPASLAPLPMSPNNLTIDRPFNPSKAFANKLIPVVSNASLIIP